MTKDDIIRMAREAASEDGSIDRCDGKNIVLYAAKTTRFLERFAALVAAAQREKVAHWMRSMGYATGQGKTTEDLLDFLGVGIDEGLEAEVLMEREACAKVCDAVSASADKSAVNGQYLIIRNGAEARRCAAAIRARGNK